MFGALRAHTKAPYKTDLLWKTLRALNKEGGPGPCAGKVMASGFAMIQSASEEGRQVGPKDVQVGPCIPVGWPLENAGVGPAPGPTWRLSHLSSSDEARRGESGASDWNGG
jgi:hypothetical protein